MKTFSSFILSVLAVAALVGAPAAVAQQATAAAATAAVPDTPADALNRPETVITSDELDMVGGEETNHFFFRGNVRIEATNMLATCDQMEVVSARQASAATAPAPAQADAAGAANIGSIREIIMTGNVIIAQEGRRATAGKATLYPQEGRVVLEDSPRVTDEQGTLSGWRMELNRGEKTVRILSNPAEGGRTRVTLPSMQDLGYRDLVGGDAAATDAEAKPAGAADSAGSATAGSAAAGSTTGAAGTAAPQAGGAAAASGKDTSSGASSTSATGTPAAADSPADKEEASPRENSGRGWNPVTSSRRR